MEPKKRTKPRRRVVNKERYAKEQRRKEATKALRQSMAISRKARNAINYPSLKHSWSLNGGTNKNLIIVLLEGSNTDRIIFRIESIGKCQLLMLPTINDGKLGEYLHPRDGTTVNWEDAVLSYVRQEFGVVAQTISTTERSVILTDCKKISKKSGYVALDVKEFAATCWDRWTGGPGLRERRVYRGSQLKEYFILHANIPELRVHYDTLLDIYESRTVYRKVATA